MKNSYIVNTNYPPKTFEDVNNINSLYSTFPQNIEFIGRSHFIDLSPLNLCKLWRQIDAHPRDERLRWIFKLALELKLNAYHLGIELALAEYYLKGSHNYEFPLLSARFATHRAVQNYIFRYGVCLEKLMNTFIVAMYPKTIADHFYRYVKKRKTTRQNQ